MNDEENKRPKEEKNIGRIENIISWVFVFLTLGLSLMAIGFFIVKFPFSVSENIFSSGDYIKIGGFLALPFAMSFLMFYILQYISNIFDRIQVSPQIKISNLLLRFFYISISIFALIFSLMSIYTFFNFIEHYIPIEGILSFGISIFEIFMAILVLSVIYWSMFNIKKHF